MAKISDSDRIKQLERQLIEVTEDRDNLAENFVRASNKLVNLKQQQNELTESTAELVNKKDESRVVDYNGPDFDDVLNKQLDELTIKNAITTRVYWGRFVTIHSMGDGSIIL